MFTNQYEHTIDAKGRMFIPAKYRERLGSSLYLCMGVDMNLYIMTVEDWEAYRDRLLEAVSETEDRDLLRYFFGCTTDVQVDSQGRILIPASYMEYAGLKDSATIVGCGKRAEIWAPDKWAAYNSGFDPAAAAAKLSAYRL